MEVKEVRRKSYRSSSFRVSQVFVSSRMPIDQKARKESYCSYSFQELQTCDGPRMSIQQQSLHHFSRSHPPLVQRVIKHSDNVDVFGHLHKLDVEWKSRPANFSIGINFDIYKRLLDLNKRDSLSSGTSWSEVLAVLNTAEELTSWQHYHLLVGCGTYLRTRLTLPRFKEQLQEGDSTSAHHNLRKAYSGGELRRGRRSWRSS